MYGMIHTAARQMVLDRFGPEAWERVIARAGFDSMHFINGEVYGDDVTLALVGAIVAESGMPADELLRAFGKYWIGYVTTSPFAAAFNATGHDFTSFVDGLDRLHRSVRTAMPRANMPKFEVLETAPGRVDILYSSTRAGLEPFVAGLLLGLLERFGESGEISYSPGEGGVVFAVAMRARAAA